MNMNDLQTNRSRALVYYREHREKINLRRRLPNLFRTAVRRNSAHKKQELNRLAVAARRILKPRRTPAEAKLMRVLRRRFNKAFKLQETSSYILRLCGVSLDGLRDHLEAQFCGGMAWHNYGFEGWHIDHRRPLCSFNLSDPEQQKLAFHYTNLQPLWKADNFSKGRKRVVDTAFSL